MAHDRRETHPGDAALEAIAIGSVALTARVLASAELELTIVQWRVLVIVGEDADGTTVSEIARRLGAEVSPVSKLVSRLRRRGLLSSRKDDLDRRVTRVLLTDAGRGLRESVLLRRRILLAEVLAAAGPIEPDLAAALDRIGRAFRPYV